MRLDPVTGSCQQRRGWIAHPSRGWRRALMRMPLLYWRLGLKPLLVRARLCRFLVLTTKGRKSGRTRHTMLAHVVLDGRIYIGAGWGENTQWYRNILADPRVTVQARGPALGAVARVITDDAERRRLYWHLRGISPLWLWRRALVSRGIRDEVEDFVVKKEGPHPVPVLGSAQRGPTAAAAR
jgi:deazaflavin-dependent oxidoreductase (nitroreductase family)